jgi:ubiquinone biosynthesis protein
MFNVPRHFAGMKRFERILAVLTKHGLGFALEKMRLKKRNLFSKKKISKPVELRLMFEELGGSFIKLGQLLSMRPDLIPSEYCDELGKLLDSLEPFPFVEVEHVIKSELKKPIKKIFRSFEAKPLAAASIGQVHTAKLMNGKKVAVEVMRPGIRAIFSHDLEIMDYLARHFKHYLKPGIFDPEEIFAEFKRYTENELDYLKEAHNIKLFCNHFGGDRKLKLPRVYDRLTTSRVLVMDFVEGVELQRILREPAKHKGVNTKRLAKDIMDCFFNQIFIKGIFHADPHPGNIVINKGKIGLLDFGVIGRLDDEMKEKLGRMMISIIEGDTNNLTKAMISLNLANSDVNVTGLREDLANALGEYSDVGVEKVDLTALFFKCIEIAKKYDIKISKDYVLLGKSLITLKTICFQLDPEFNLTREARPFIKKMIDEKTRPSYLVKRLSCEAERFSEFIHDMPDEAKKVCRTMDKADLALDEISSDLHGLTREMRREGGRLIFGIVIAALVISASLIYSSSPVAANFFIIVAGLLFIYILISIMKDIFSRKR